MVAKLIPAVSYLRKSSDQQKESIEQQRAEVAALALKEGYVIVEEYAEPEGMSGTLEDRPAWTRLLLDSHKRSFKTVLMWAVSRLGRVHPLTAGAWKDTLRKNGVSAHTVVEGRLNWDSLEGLLVDLLHAQGARQYSVNIGKDSIRGRLDLLARGRWPNGPVPYGFDKLMVDSQGNKHLIGRKVQMRKGRDWDRLLVINEAEAEVARRIFRELTTMDTSIRGIAYRLQLDGILPPKGKVWTKDTVSQLVKNKAYCGYGHIGGAHSRLRGKTPHNRAGAHEKAGCCPPIVSLEVWERAQAILQARRDGYPVPRSSTSSVLSGLLRCGHCGYTLSKRSRTDASGQRYNYYACETPLKRPGMGCHQYQVRETLVLPLAIEALVKEVDRSVLESAARPDGVPVPRLDSLKAHLDELKAKIAKGSERYLTAPDAMVDQLRRTLDAWRKEAEDLSRRIEEQTMTAGAISAFAAWWERVKGNLVEVVPLTWKPIPDRPRLEAPVPGILMESAKVRTMLKGLGLSITCYWKPAPARLGKGLSVRNFTLDRARLTAEIRNASATHSNSYSHEGTRDRG